MRTLGLVFFAICLAGCYETVKPVLEKGEKTVFSGNFSCESISGKKESLNVTEQKEGFWPFASYRYADSKGEATLFKKLPSGMFLGQEREKQGAYSYFYLDVVDKNTFVLLVPDLMSKAPYIDALVKKNKIETTKRFPNVRLKGDNGALLDFLATHDKTLLSAVATCLRRLEVPMSSESTPKASPPAPVVENASKPVSEPKVSEAVPPAPAKPKPEHREAKPKAAPSTQIAKPSAPKSPPGTDNDQKSTGITAQYMKL